MKAFRQGDERNGVVFEAVGFATSGAGKMHMIEVVTVLAAANTVFSNARTVVYFMQNLVFSEETECPKNAGTIHFWEPFFHICERKCLRTVLYGLVDEISDRCRTDVMLLQSFFNVRLHSC